MQKTISAIKVRQNLGSVMNEVALKEDEYIVERAGKPLVAIIPIAQYEQIKRQREEFFSLAGELRENVTPDADLDKEIAEAVGSVRIGKRKK